MPHYAGIDVSKHNLHVIVLDENGTETDAFQAPNTPRGHAKTSQRLPEDAQAGIEATTHAYPLAEHLLREDICVQLGHATKLSKMMDPDYKDDDRDAWHLADLLRVGRFPPAYHPDPNAFLARDALRRRIDLGEQTKRTKQRITALIDRYGLEPPVKDVYCKTGIKWLKDAGLGDDRDTLLRHYAEQLELYQAQKTELEEELAKRAFEVPEVKHLVTIEGIGFYSALVLVFEIGPLERFKNLGKFRGYVGSAPRVAQSGDKEVVDGNASSYNRRIKAVLGRAVNCLLRSPRENPIRDYYRKQRREGCTSQQAMSRARGKLSNHVYAMLRKGEACEWADPAFAQRKVAKLERWAARARA